MRGGRFHCIYTYTSPCHKADTGRFANVWSRFTNIECQFANAYMPVTTGANIQNTFSFGLAVDERTRSNWYACKGKKWTCSLSFSCVGKLTLNVGKSTSYLGKLVVSELTHWRNDQLPTRHIGLWHYFLLALIHYELFSASYPFTQNRNAGRCYFMPN